MAKTKRLPMRSKVKPADTWDLSSLFKSDDEWERAFIAWEKQIPQYEKFRGTLGDGPAALVRLFEFDREFDRAAERLGTYAHLKTTEDMADSRYQRMFGRYEHAGTLAAEAASFIRPEILSLSSKKLSEYLAAKPLRPFKLQLERLVRYKPHTLTPGEEKLLAMQHEMAGAADRVFRQLTDADLKFGMCRNEKGESIELSHSSFASFLRSPSRDVRRKAFHQYYAQFQGHENSLAASYSSSVQKDVYYAKARNYPSAREGSLFHDNVPVAVYDNLIAAVRGKLPAVYKYFDLRRRKMRLRDIHHYDTYVPILSELDTRHNWSQAVDVVVKSLEPLGDEYCGVLHEGLSGRWCDRYPNQGKRSGAFSSGSYDGWPYILMNYQPEVLDHVFTLAHEAGHSMHSYYSAKHQPYQYYNYTIFVAEVASTFNEQLLSRHLMARAQDQERTRLPHQPRNRRHPRHDHPPDHVRRIRKDLPRPRRSRRTPHRRNPQNRIWQTIGRLLRPRFRHRRRTQARVPPHSALLSRVLRLQIRHRSLRRHRTQRTRGHRRQARTQRLPLIPQRRLLQVAARPPQRRRRRYDEPRAGRDCAVLFRTTR